jgi:hypothetical protein
MFVGYPSSTVYAYIGFTSSDQIRYASTNSGASLTTTPVYRDPSAWYHIVFAYDDTQATASNRLKLYVNGVQVTAFGTASYPTQNFGDYINSASVHNLGRFPSGVEYCDCYFAEVNFIDGQALTPSSFGAYDSTGVWQPMAYSGTYGTNGFYLTFADNSAATATTLGKDYSGNGNNWTPNNISVTAGVTYDWMLDSPTNYPTGTAYGVGNYCVINPLDTGSSATVANGNLSLTYNASAWRMSRGTIGITSGKWYWEGVFTAGGTANANSLGIAQAGASLTNYVGSSLGYSYLESGQKIGNGSITSYGASFTTGDIIGAALDLDAGTLTFYKNNTSQGVAFTGITGQYFFAVDAYNNSAWAVNFGQRPFAYTPPTGFKALNTVNLPAVTINNGAQYMAATTFIATGTTQVVTNTGFQPDFLWFKRRDTASNHFAFNSVVGDDYYLVPNLTDAEGTSTTFISSLNSNGFTMGTGNYANTSSVVCWNWKAGGNAASNTSGSITSSVSANTTAGFSIVTYTGNGTNGATVGHSLGVKPKMIIEKGRTSTYNWSVQGCGELWSPATSTLFLNTTAALNAGGAVAAPTTSVFTPSIVAYANESGVSNVAYVFSEVAGYSKFGSYTGNGSADGPFIYTGFRPRFVMIKRTDTTGNWEMHDTSRSTYNVDMQRLWANLSNAEDATEVRIDELSNGFKLRSGAGDVNVNSGTYIYMAVAENPFNISRAR